MFKSKIWIKIGLVICTENVKIPTYIINSKWKLKYKRNYTNKRSLTRVNLSADARIDQYNVIIDRLLTNMECRVKVNTYQNYNMMILTEDEKCIFPMKDDQGHLE